MIYNIFHKLLLNEEILVFCDCYFTNSHNNLSRISNLCLMYWVSLWGADFFLLAVFLLLTFSVFCRIIITIFSIAYLYMIRSYINMNYIKELRINMTIKKYYMVYGLSIMVLQFKCNLAYHIQCTSTGYTCITYF